MPVPLALEIVEHMSRNQKHIYKDMLDALAKVKRTRLVVIKEMPRSVRHPEILAILQQTHAIQVAFQILTAWLLDTQQPLLTAFLESLGIPHDGSGCVDEFPEPPDRDKVLQAAEMLVTKFPPQNAIIYMHAFNSMPETQWESLDEILGSDPRFRLENAA